MSTPKNIKAISAQKFLQVFKSQWDELKRNVDMGKVVRAYKDNTEWTAWMLGETRGKIPPPQLGEKGLLGLCGKDLGFCDEQIRREDSKMDMMFVDGKSLFGGTAAEPHWGYPSHLSVLIEHENNLSDTRCELWKLLFWRSPLKIIVTYDERRDELSDACLGQLKKLSDMRRDVDKDYSSKEGDDSEYLVLIGQRDLGDSVHWRWTVDFGDSLPLGEL